MEHPLRCECEKCRVKRKITSKIWSLHNKIDRAYHSGSHDLEKKLRKEFEALESELEEPDVLEKQ